MTPPPCKGVYGFYVTGVVPRHTAMRLTIETVHTWRLQEEYVRLVYALILRDPRL